MKECTSASLQIKYKSVISFKTCSLALGEVLQVLVCVAAASAWLTRRNTANQQRSVQHVLKVRAPVARREQPRVVSLSNVIRQRAYPLGPR